MEEQSQHAIQEALRAVSFLKLSILSGRNEIPTVIQNKAVALQRHLVLGDPLSNLI